MARISALDLGQGFSNGEGNRDNRGIFSRAFTASGTCPRYQIARVPLFYRNRGRIAALVETFNLLLRFLSVFSLFLSCSFLSDSLSTGEILQKN